MWIDTTIINCLKEKPVEVREGHRTTFTSVSRLWPGQSHRINYDMNATYRKYMIVGPGDVRKYLNSDEIIENSVVKVVESFNEEGWDLELIKRDANQRSSVHRHYSWFSRVMGRGSSD